MFRCVINPANTITFHTGVGISQPVVQLLQNNVNKRKQERELLNKICIVSMLARLRLMPKGCAQ
ncbi:cell division inhibition protein DicB [Escherichia coli]